MDGAFKNEIRIATEIARRQSETLYGYYLVNRPPEPGAQPSGVQSMVSLKFRTWHDDLYQDIWGWVCYTRPLSESELEEYEMLPDESNPCEYTRYALVLKTQTKDANGKRVIGKENVLDDTGKPVIYRYKRKALAVMCEMNKAIAARNDGDDVAEVKVIKLKPKPSA